MATVCPAGSATQPIPGQEHKYVWSAISYVNSAVLAAIDPFLDVLGHVFAPELFSVDDLCAQNIEVPPIFTNGDWTSVPNDFSGTGGWPSVAFVNKLNQYIQAGMWKTFCQCGPSTAPTPPPPPGSCNTFGNSRCDSIGFAWDPASTSLECLYGCSYYVNIAWLFSTSNTARIFVCSFNDAGPGMPTAGCFPTASGWYEITGGSWTPVSGGLCGTGYEYTPGQYGPFVDISQVDCTPVFGSSPSPWRLGVSFAGDTGLVTGNFWGASATFALSCSPAPPTNPSPPTITVPTPPAPACDSTTLCNISWAIWKTTQTSIVNNSNTNNQVTDITVGTTPVSTLAPDYTEGSTHSLSGSGSGTVAAGTLGLRVTLDSLPSWLPSESTDPISYFNAGWVVLGSDDGWDNKRWLHYDAQLVFPAFPKVTRFAWNLEGGVTATATELVPPPPAP